jgi:hypothetical protein
MFTAHLNYFRDLTVANLEGEVVYMLGMSTSTAPSFYIVAYLPYAGTVESRSSSFSFLYVHFSSIQLLLCAKLQMNFAEIHRNLSLKRIDM